MTELSQIRQGALAPANTADVAEAMMSATGLRIDIDRRRGRGAGINMSGRFEPRSRETFDDGWESLEDLPPFKTEVQVEKPRTVITRNESPDISFDRSINPYRGCEHGCIYCFARPTHAYMGLSAGLDFEAKLFAKPDAPRLLERELARQDYKVRPIAIGTNTDPYQPIEKEWRIMRQILEVLRDANHPVMIVTKSAMVTRDIDILAPMAEKDWCASASPSRHSTGSSPARWSRGPLRQASGWRRYACLPKRASRPVFSFPYHSGAERPRDRARARRSKDSRSN